MSNERGYSYSQIRRWCMMAHEKRLRESIDQAKSIEPVDVPPEVRQLAEQAAEQRGATDTTRSTSSARSAGSRGWSLKTQREERKVVEKNNQYLDDETAIYGVMKLAEHEVLRQVALAISKLEPEDWDSVLENLSLGKDVAYKQLVRLSSQGKELARKARAAYINNI